MLMDVLFQMTDVPAATVTLWGEKVSDSVIEIVVPLTGLTVIFEVAEYPFMSLASIVAELGEVTAPVPIVNVAELFPAATVTFKGNLTNDCMVERLKTNPPDGALADKVTVPVAVAPAFTVAGETLILTMRTLGTLTTTVAELE